MKYTDAELPVELRREYSPDVLSDRYKFTRGQVANIFFRRSYGWLQDIESRGFEIPEGVEYEPPHELGAHRTFSLKDIDALATSLAYNRLISTDRAMRIFNLLYDLSENWNRR